MSENQIISRFSYTVNEYTVLILIYGEYRRNTALALHTYFERYGNTRVCPTNSWTVVQAFQGIRENKYLVPNRGSGPPVVTLTRDN